MKNTTIGKILALVLVAVMLFALAACGNNANNAADNPAATPAPAENTPAAQPSEDGAPDDTATAEEWLIGSNVWGTGPPVLEMMNAASLYVIDNMGCKSMNVSDDFSSDVTIQNMQKFLGAGVDGANIYCNAATTLPGIAQMFSDAKTFFALNTGIGTEDQLPDLQANEYFAGCVDANCVLAGEQMAQLAYDDGCRKAVMIGGNIGDTNHDQRSEGFTRVFTSLGGEVLDEARCSDNSEAITKAGDMLSANREADCIYCFVGDYVNGAQIAKTDLGLDNLKIYVSNVDGDTAQMIKEGTVAGGNDGTTMPCMIGSVLVMNALDGYKVTNTDGVADHFQTTPIVITTDNVDLYIDVFCTDGKQPIADSILESILYRFNPELTYDAFADTVSNQLTLDKLAEAQGVG